MMEFQVVIVPDDNDTFLVTCPLLPEVTTFFGEGDKDREAIVIRAVEEALAARIANGEDIPYPPAVDPSDALVRLPTLTTLKIALYGACRDMGVTRAELVRRLGWHREQVDRLFRIDHASRLDQIDAAMAAIGLSIDVRVQSGAAA